MAAEVLLPTTPAEAIAAFGDGSGVTVVGGGTIVMPEVTAGRLRPDRVLMLARAGLSGVSRRDGAVTIGAATPVAELVGGDQPLASAAAHVADPEIRAQATIAGNLCAAPGEEAPRGDLQAPLMALGAQIRSIGAGGERSESVESFLSGDGAGRLVLDVSYPDARRSASYASVHRPHSHHYSILTVCCVREGDETRVAVGGAGPHAVRVRSVEAALAAGETGPAAALKILDDVDPADDALASAWYRKRVLPTLVARALADLEKENA
jgi:CO/xanthine dehydrogenase FAD-binding subunit